MDIPFTTQTITSVTSFAIIGVIIYLGPWHQRKKIHDRAAYEAAFDPDYPENQLNDIALSDGGTAAIGILSTSGQIWLARAMDNNISGRVFSVDQLKTIDVVRARLLGKKHQRVAFLL